LVAYRSRWVASLAVNRTKHHLGDFDDEQAAAAHYADAKQAFEDGTLADFLAAQSASRDALKQAAAGAAAQLQAPRPRKRARAASVRDAETPTAAAAAAAAPGLDAASAPAPAAGGSLVEAVGKAAAVAAAAEAVAAPALTPAVPSLNDHSGPRGQPTTQI
jgi:hypothetical protein